MKIINLPRLWQLVYSHYVFFTPPKRVYQLGTRLITSNLRKLTITGICVASSFTVETTIQVHANQGKIIALKSFQLIKTHGGRVRNIELGLLITDKSGANALFSADKLLQFPSVDIM